MKNPVDFYSSDRGCPATPNATAASWKSTLDCPGFRTPTRSAPRLIAAALMQRHESESQESPPRNNITSTAPSMRRYCRLTLARVNWVAKYRLTYPARRGTAWIVTIASRIPANRPIFKRGLALRTENRSRCGVEYPAELHCAERQPNIACRARNRGLRRRRTVTNGPGYSKGRPN